MQVTLMGGVEDVIDGFSGFVTRRQALSMSMSDSPSAKSQRQGMSPGSSSTVSVQGLIDRAYLHDHQDATVDIKDIVYRIFNPSRIKTIKGETDRRIVVLGREGATLPLSLIGSSSDFMDAERIERGDSVVARNLVLSPEKDMLYGTGSTAIVRTAKSMDGPVSVSDISSVSSKYVDVVGKVTEIDQIRYIKKESRVITASACTITDSKESVRISLFGSSATYISNMPVSRYMKVEFCRISDREGTRSLIADSYSRILKLGRTKD